LTPPLADTSTTPPALQLEEQPQEQPQPTVPSTFSRKWLSAGTENCVTLSAATGTSYSIDWGEEIPSNKDTSMLDLTDKWIHISDDSLQTVCHTYPKTLGTTSYTVNLMSSSLLFSLDLAHQQLISLSGDVATLPTTGLKVSDNCLDAALLDTGTIQSLNQQLPDRHTTQGVCIGNLITKGINIELAFGKFHLYGSEEKKAVLVTKYRYTFGHMFTENEVYTFDFSGIEQTEVLNLPTPPTLNAKAIKL
jgi:hypothetical protein